MRCGDTVTTVPGTRAFQESSHSRQNALARAPSPEAIVTPAETSDLGKRSSLFLVARLGGEGQAH